MRMRLPRRRERGFVAVFVAAMILLLTGIVLEGTRNFRGKARQTAMLTERLAGDVRAVAAARWLKSRIEAQWASGFLERPDLTLLAQLQPSLIAIDDAPVQVRAEDADIKPDANLFDADEWERLLVAYRMPVADARAAARRLLAKRNAAPGGKFASIQEIIDDPGLPEALHAGVESDAGAWVPPLAELLSIGSEGKRLHVANAPLVLFAVLFQAPPEQIARLNSIRNQRQARVEDAVLIFGGSAQQGCYEGNPQRLRFVLEVERGGSNRAVFVRIEKNRLLAKLAPASNS